jgi:D-beta-D-heptose 7-phosphate kinase/D-beta-D-heptose 1-phosphate adenosyltransferase
LGAQVSLIALVGDDIAQTHIPQLLSDAGVADDGLIRDPNRPTTVKTRVLAAHHQLLRFDQERVTTCSDTQAAAVMADFERRAHETDVVLLSDYGKGLLSERLVRELIAGCKRAGLPVLIDPKGTDYARYHGATLLTPNRKEAAAATGLTLSDSSAVAAAGRKLLRDLALEACLITLSEDGMALFQGEHVHHLPTQAREVFDVTGAGDTVIATIAFSLAAGLSLLDACHVANLAAGIVVGKLGTATVTLAELMSERPSRPASGGALSKILSRAALQAEVARLRAAGAKVVFTNGCFDILHAGHVQYLEQAASLGDALVVGLNSDDSVRRLKGPQRPINPEADRALLLAALASVSYVTSFGEDTPAELIAEITPDVLVKGGDYRPDDIVGADHVRSHGGSVQVLPFVEGRSTTRIIARAAEGKS